MSGDARGCCKFRAAQPGEAEFGFELEALCVSRFEPRCHSWLDCLYQVLVEDELTETEAETNLGAFLSRAWAFKREIQVLVVDEHDAAADDDDQAIESDSGRQGFPTLAPSRCTVTKGMEKELASTTQSSPGSTNELRE